MDGSSTGVKLTLGSLRAIGPAATPDRLIRFQFNPDSVVRNVRRRGGRDESGPAESHSLRGAPVETISMTIELDATDSFAGRRVPDVAAQLAELELLLYPSAAAVAANDELLGRGTIEILPAEGPLVLLNWGARRTVPVRLDSLQITEQAFDPWLCPVRASVDISLQVLSYDDLLIGDPGRAYFRTHHETLERTRDLRTAQPPGHTVEKSPGSAP